MGVILETLQDLATVSSWKNVSFERRGCHLPTVCFTAVNTSLLESESIHLPLICDSPPKSKTSSNDGISIYFCINFLSMYVLC